MLQSTNSGGSGFSTGRLQALEHRFSGSGPRVQLLRGLRDLPRPEIKPISPALAGGFLTTGSPGEPYFSFFYWFIIAFFFFFFLGGEVRGFPHSSVSKESACNAGDPGSIPRSGRSPGEGNANPFQYSCLENPMDGGAWQATVHGVARVEQELATELPLL